MSRVKDFGARGDGTTDDTRAIQHAVAATSDGLIEFPRGDYRIEHTIEVRLAEQGRTSLSGLGGVGRVIMAGAGPAFRFVGTHDGNADPKNVAPHVWRQERMPQLHGLEITGAHPEADGVQFVRVMQPTLRGVLLRGLRHGVHLVERNRNLLVESCHIYDCGGVGVFFDRVNLHQSIIHGCHISYCRAGGIKVVASEIRNLQITGNDIEYNFDPHAGASADVWIDCQEGSVREGTITGNTIQALESPGGANLRFAGAGSVNQVSMWTIASNHVSNQRVNVHLRNCRGMVFTGNSLALGKDRSFLLEGCRHIVIGPHSLDHNPDYGPSSQDGIRLENCDGCLLQGVLIEGAKSGTETEGGAIELVNCRETTIQGCQVFEPLHRGIFTSGGRNLHLADCMVLDRTGASGMQCAIEMQGESPGSVVRGNLVGQGSRGEIVAHASVVVEQNRAAAR